MRQRPLQTTIRQTTAVLSVVIVFMCSACAPPLPPPDPARAAQLRSEGLKLNLKHDYEAAAEQYRQATLYEPQNSSAWLNLTELQEAINQPEAAFEAYEQALKSLPGTDSNREFITYRSALLLAWRLDSPDKAENRLRAVHSPELAKDLTGVIALSRNDARQALVQFQDALQHTQDKDRFARIYFHIALAYDRLGDEDQSRDALLISVEKAQSRALKEDIRRFFEGLLGR